MSGEESKMAISDEELWDMATDMKTVSEALKYVDVNLIWDNGPESTTHRHNFKDCWGETTLLHHACYCENEEMVKYLLEHGADPDIEIHDETPLEITCCEWAEPCFPIVKLLVDHGAEITPDALWSACEQGDTDTIRYLVEHGGELDNDCFIQYFYNAKCNTELREYLLDHGADINGYDEIHGWTALMFVIDSGDSDDVRFLLDHGADVHLRDGLIGSTSIMLAHDIDMISLLLSYGANVNVKDDRGWTALMYAREHHDEELVRFLLEHGAED